MHFKQLTLGIAVLGLAALLALNLRAQLRTQEKLDALTATLAEQRANPPAAPQPAAPAVAVPEPGAVPRELSNVKLPPYVIEAPDVLTVEAGLKDPRTGKVERLPVQTLSGQHIVRLDGTVNIGYYGSVAVSGLTPEQAATAIKAELAKFASPEMPAERLAVTVDVLSYNSKVYYVITDASGGGEQVFRLPLTGNETVLDAIANVDGLAEVAGKKSVSIFRKPTNGVGRVLPVDWKAITQHGVTATNYQLVPSDRVYVKNAGE